jgi:hypothetical protein
MKKQSFNVLIALLSALVLFALYITFWKAQESPKHIEEQNPAPYIEDIYSSEMETIDESRDESISINRPTVDKTTISFVSSKKDKPLSVAYDTHEEMEEHTEDIYDALVPDDHEESIANADEAFETLDTQVLEVSEMMQEHQEISSSAQETVDEMYQSDNDYEMELPVINE